MEATFKFPLGATPTEAYQDVNRESQHVIEISTAETGIGQPSDCVLVRVSHYGTDRSPLLAHAWLPASLARAIASALMGAAADARG